MDKLTALTLTTRQYPICKNKHFKIIDTRQLNFPFFIPVDTEMDSTELIVSSARQYPLDGNLVHTFGQLIAVAGPYLLNLNPVTAITSLGLLSILTGILLVSIVQTGFSEETTIDNNLSFGLLSGGVLSTISSQYQQSQQSQTRVSNTGISSSSASSASSNTLTCATNFYKESDGVTCTGQSNCMIKIEIFQRSFFSACDCDVTGSSSQECADSTGLCTCNAGYKGTKCDTACGCITTGSSGTACDQSTGQCSCNTGYTGTTCNTCDTNYYKESDGVTCTGQSF